MTAAYDSGGAALQPKQQPETLELRAQPRPVVRFRRGLIMALVGTTALTIGALTWWALEPTGLQTAASDDLGSVAAGRTPDALANAPIGYGDVPKLGPPLPGDLGRPILEHQRKLGASDDEGDADRALAAERAERQRQAAEAQSARASAVLVQLAERSNAAPEKSAHETSKGKSGGPSGTMRDPPTGVVEAASPWTISAGSVIPASLITGINSDLPGMVIAQITEPVRDSATGRTVLIPQGAKLIGGYDSKVAYGQRRAMVVWDRIVFPDGAAVELEKMPASDAAGYAGLEDRVDFYVWRLLQGVGMATVLGIGSELARPAGRSALADALLDGVQQSSSKSGDQITQRNLDIQPTLRIRPGWPVRVLVNRDLALRPWQER